LIDELTLRGFKSYRNRQTVRFTQGVNKISGRNASGKTTLLQAVLFGLFGDVPGVNKQDLIPMGGGNVEVTVRLRSPFDGRRVTVHREGGLAKDGGFRTSKSVLSVEGEAHPYVRDRDIQAKLRELLGVGRSTFFNIVYAQQKEFVEILKPERRRMDAILGLTTPAEIREQFREVARMLKERGRIDERGRLEERVRNAEEGCRDCDRQLQEVAARKMELSEGLDEMRAELTLLDGRVEDLGAVLQEFRRMESARTELGMLQEQGEEKELSLADLLTDMGEDPESMREELQRRRRSAEATEEQLRRQLDDNLSAQRVEAASSIARLEHQIGDHAALREQGLTVCPKCGQEIDYKLLEEDVGRWEEELGSERSRLKSLEEEIRILRGQVNVAQAKYKEADRAVVRFVEKERRTLELKRELENLKSRVANLQSRIRRESEALMVRAETELAMAFASLEDAQMSLERQMERTRREQMELRAEVRSREDRLRDAERREKQITERKEEYDRVRAEALGLLDRIAEYEAKIRTLEALQRRYGEYEQQLRENTLRLLEYQTYNYFRRLTDQQAYAACHIDRERYTLEVQPLGGDRLIPAWLAGGGHESLLALAERLALLRVMGFPHALILDEPTDAVDSENVPQLLEYIARSSREIGQVLLVTHHGHGEEEGVNLISVRKVGGESRVYQELGEE